MLGDHLFPERLAVERLGLTAGLALDQLAPDCVDSGSACLVAADQVADVLAVVCEIASGDLRLDPLILLNCHGNRFSHGPHSRLHGGSV